MCGSKEGEVFSNRRREQSMIIEAKMPGILSGPEFFLLEIAQTVLNSIIEPFLTFLIMWYGLC